MIKFSIIVISLLLFHCSGSSDSNSVVANYILSKKLLTQKKSTLACADVKCTANPNALKKVGIFEVLSDPKYVTVNGTFDKNSCKDFQTILKSYCNIKTIILIGSDGSSDDQTTIALSKLVHYKKLNTHLSKYQSAFSMSGLISSGAVDFFLAGRERTRGQSRKDAADGATGNRYGQFGVHAWAGENEFDAYNIRNDRKNPLHKPYIEYYKSIGFKQAEDFYFFTISKARASGMHYMLEKEILQYGMLTNTKTTPIKVGNTTY